MIIMKTPIGAMMSFAAGDSTIGVFIIIILPYFSS